MTTRAFLGASSLLMCLLGAPLAAHAQPGAEGRAPPADDSDATALPPGIVLPVPISTPAAPYPPGGTGDAVVVLALTIETDGRVSAAEVRRGDEPFASAARRAALRWRFEPATDRGVPFASTVSFEATFTQEVIVEETPAETEPIPSLPPELAPIDVYVQGEKNPPSVTTLTRADVRQIPGAFGDPFRAIEILPGVTPVVSGLPFFYVRGAPPGNVGYFLDGVRVPYLFHAAAGPSVVHPALVEQVDLYAGAYPARYGRYAGAIVAAETTAPNPTWHGEGSVRLVDAGALVEGGFADGRGTALVGGRYSYTAGLFSLISPEITLDYRDYQARVSYDLTDHDRLSVFAFGSYDFLSQLEANDVETVIFGSEFYRIDSRYDVSFPGGGGLRAAVTWGLDQTRVADGRNTRDVLVGSRVILDKPLSPQLTLRAGMDVQHDVYSSEQRLYFDPDDPEEGDFDALFPPRTDAAAAAWIDAQWRPVPRMKLTPGARLDTFFSGGAKAVAVDPRLAVEIDLTEHVRLLHAVGTAHQPPGFIVPIPGLAVANLQGGLQRSIQTSAGVEVQLPWATTGKVTVFDNVFLNMTDTIGVRPPGDQATQIPRSLGSAKGLEVMVQRSFSKRLGGFLSYTFSRTTRALDRYTFPSAFDRTHVLNAALGYDLGGGIRTGSRLALYSGSPNLAPPAGAALDFRPTNPPRDPVFYRIDFRVEKRWPIADTGFISLVVEMLNTTLNVEVLKGREIGPVTIPSIGVEGGF